MTVPSSVLLIGLCDYADLAVNQFLFSIIFLKAHYIFSRVQAYRITIQLNLHYLKYDPLSKICSARINIATSRKGFKEVFETATCSRQQFFSVSGSTLQMRLGISPSVWGACKFAATNSRSHIVVQVLCIPQFHPELSPMLKFRLVKQAMQLEPFGMSN